MNEPMKRTAQKAGITGYMQSAIIWLLVLAACSFCTPSALAKSSLPELMTNLAPDDWELYGQVRRYGPVDLYELINGAAELYLAYDMKDLNLSLIHI